MATSPNRQLPDRLAQITIEHQFPGRVRLRITALPRHPDAAARLEHDLSLKPGIDDVEVQARDGFVIARYHPARLNAGRVAEMARTAFLKAATMPLPEGEFHRAADIKIGEQPWLNPLLVPTIAAGVMAMEAAPPALAVGALAAAMLPSLKSAISGVQRGCLVSDQLDLGTAAILAARGQYPVAGVFAWLLAAKSLTRKHARQIARNTLSEWQSSEERRAERIPWESSAARDVEMEPASNTHAQTGALQTSSRLGLPALGLAAVDFAATRDPSRTIDILKPRCEYEAAALYIAPTNVLTALTAAAQNGVLFRGGKALERLAHADSAVVLLGARGSARRQFTDALQSRGINVQPADTSGAVAVQQRTERGRPARNGGRPSAVRAAAKLLVALSGSASSGDAPDGRTTAWITDGPRRLQEPRPGDVRILIARPDSAADEAADVVLIDDDPNRLLYAIDVARETVRTARQINQVLGGTSYLNVLLTLLGLSPAPVSSLINTGASITAAMSALRPPTVSTRSARAASGANGGRPRDQRPDRRR